MVYSSKFLDVCVCVCWFWLVRTEQPQKLTKPGVMGGHRGFIVHFDWTDSQQDVVVVVVVGMGGEREREVGGGVK